MNTPARHAFSSGLLAQIAMLVLLLQWGGAALAFGFGDVAQRAQQLAAASFKKQNSALSKDLRALDYDQYRDIRFRPERALWRDARLPFEVQFFHQGRHYDKAVKINEVYAGGISEIRFDPSMFNYGANALDPLKLRDLGLAGFRVHYSINTAKYKDEILVFLGASYFRSVGMGQHYGLSARGLAIDTALASGEEFPAFVEFWIERPHAEATELTIYALLDSPRASGAYRFKVRPGRETVVDVKARLYLRERVGRIGLAPLTSMFLFGENQHPVGDDYRPEVHDSDGLSIHSASGEWLWRPLVNPKRLLVTSFAMNNPRGFGLMQRDRDFAHYEDTEGRYELRPSAWIEPTTQWGAGSIELVQIPVPDETNDNIVAYWVPDKPPHPKTPYDFSYRLHWQGGVSTAFPPSARVTQTRRGRGFTLHPDNSVAFNIDFDGPALRGLKADSKPESVVSTGGNGEVLERTLYRNVVTGAWRLTIRVRRIEESKPVELRAHLRNGNSILSETWSYIIPPA